MPPSPAGGRLAIHVNGKAFAADGWPPPATLLDFLRARGLTGAKEGCAEGECGACTVVTVATEGTGSAYRPVNSCLMFLAAAAGHEFYTVEGLAARGELADAQRVLAAAGGSQCGYCTPGFVMSLFAEHYRPDRRGPCEPLAMAGNLCRCTGYRPIRDAALALTAPPSGPFRDRLERSAPPIEPMAMPGFTRPSTIAECVSLLATDTGATVLAGGSDLVVEANLRHQRRPHFVSLEAIDELRGFSDTADEVRIGAALPLSDIGRQWRQAPPVLGEWLTLFASPPIRNRATLGGNLATASPIGDAAPLLLALDASVEIAGPAGRRTVPLSSFFAGYRRSALQRGELLVSIRVAKPLPALTRFYKVSKRRLDDISTVAAAMAMDRDDAGRVRRARFAFGGVAATPLRSVEAEALVEGGAWNEAAVERVQQHLARTLAPLGDHRGSKEYRLQVAQSLVEKFYREGPA